MMVRWHIHSKGLYTTRAYIAKKNTHDARSVVFIVVKYRPNMLIASVQRMHPRRLWVTTVKPVCNDHLYDKIYYLWFIQ